MNHPTENPNAGNASRRQRAKQLVESWFDNDFSIEAKDRLFSEHENLLPELSEEFEKSRRIREFIKPPRVEPEHETQKPEVNVDLEELIKTRAVGELKEIQISGRFGDYEIVEEIGRGGMGVVYKAKQISLNRMVALKMFRFSNLDSVDDLRRFQNEAEAIAAVDHPNIVEIYDVGCVAGQPYFAMNLADGSDLQKHISEKPMTSERTGRVCREIAAAMEYAHFKNILHRDLKPTNVLLNHNGQVQVTDFGLAKRTEEDSNLTATNQLLGTPSYMSPEQATRQSEEIDHRTDIYGIGAIMYALLTGRPPFFADNFMNTLHQVINDPVVAPRTLNPTVARDLETICLKCLEKKPEDRYASCLELIEDLDRFAHGQPVKAKRPSLLRQTVYIWNKRPRTVLAVSATALFLIFLAIMGPMVATRETRLRNQISNDSSRIERQSKDLMRQNEELALVAYSSQMQVVYEQGKSGKLDKTFIERNQGFDNLAYGIEWDFAVDFFPTIVKPLFRHSDGYWEITDFAISPNKQLIVYSDASGQLFLANLGQPNRAKIFGQADWSNGKRRPAHVLEHWIDPESVTVVSELDENRVFRQLLWLDEHQVVAVDHSGNIFLLDIESHKFEPLGSTESAVVCCENIVDEGLFLCGGDGKIWQFDLDSHLIREVADLGEAPTCVCGLGDKLFICNASNKLFRFHGTSGILESVADVDFETRNIIAVSRPSKDCLIITGNSNRIAEVDTDQFSVEYRSTNPLNTAQIVACCYDEVTDNLYYLNPDNEIYRVNPGREEFVVQTANTNMRLADLKTDLAELQVDYPDWLGDGVGKIQLVRNDTNGVTLIYGGESANIKAWKVIDDNTLDPLANTYNQATELEQVSHVEFCDQDDSLIWMMTRTGKLVLFDFQKGRAIQSVQAHPEQANEMIYVPDLNAMVTTGEEGTVKLWRYEDHQIKLVESKIFEHERPLLGVDIDTEKDLVCSVNDRSEMIIWRWSDGKQLFQLPFGNQDLRPVSGKVEFSPNGKMVFAFGGDQNSAAFSTDDFSLLPIVVELISRGGVDFAWGGNERPFIAFTDRQSLRLRTMPVSGVPFKKLIGPKNDDVVSIKAYVDHERIVGLSRNGKVNFISSKFPIAICTVDVGVRDAMDFCINRRGDRMIISDESGMLHCFETAQSIERRSYEFAERTPWKSETLYRSLNPFWINELQSVFDHQGIVLAITEPVQFRHKKLFMFFHSLLEKKTIVERIKIDGSEFDEQFDSACLGFMEEDGTILASCVRRRIDDSPYDGEMYYLKWVPGKSLKHELMIGNKNESYIFDNCGVNPIHYRNLATGNLEILHYSANGYHLIRSTFADNQWKSFAIGQQGEGDPMGYFDVGKGEELIVCTKRRFTGDDNVFIALFFKHGIPVKKLDYEFVGVRLTNENINEAPLFLCPLEDPELERLCRVTRGGLEEVKSIRKQPLLRFRRGGVMRFSDQSVLQTTFDEKKKQLYYSEVHDEKFVLHHVYTAKPSEKILQHYLVRDSNDKPVIVSLVSDKDGFVMKKFYNFGESRE